MATFFKKIMLFPTGQEAKKRFGEAFEGLFGARIAALSFFVKGLPHTGYRNSVGHYDRTAVSQATSQCFNCFDGANSSGGDSNNGYSFPGQQGWIFEVLDHKFCVGTEGPVIFRSGEENGVRCFDSISQSRSIATLSFAGKAQREFTSVEDLNVSTTGRENTIYQASNVGAVVVGTAIADD